jgi:hypothetical protein
MCDVGGLYLCIQVYASSHALYQLVHTFKEITPFARVESSEIQFFFSGEVEVKSSHHIIAVTNVFCPPGWALQFFSANTITPKLRYYCQSCKK